VVADFCHERPSRGELPAEPVDGRGDALRGYRLIVLDPRAGLRF
jgi:hypothetical protein